MALFEQNIANNAKQPNQGNGGSFLSTVASKSPRLVVRSPATVFKKSIAHDNTSIETAPTSTFTSSSTSCARSLTLSPCKSIPRDILTTGSTENVCDESSATHSIHADLVSMSKLKPGSKTNANDSWNSSISTLDLMSQDHRSPVSEQDKPSVGQIQPRATRRLSLGYSAPLFPSSGLGDSSDLGSLIMMLNKKEEAYGKSKRCQETRPKPNRRASMGCL